MAAAQPDRPAVWEERLYTGIEVEADVRRFMSGTICPAVGLNIRLKPGFGDVPGWGDGDLHLYFDLWL